MFPLPGSSASRHRALVREALGVNRSTPFPSRPPTLIPARTLTMFGCTPPGTSSSTPSSSTPQAAPPTPDVQEVVDIVADIDEVVGIGAKAAAYRKNLDTEKKRKGIDVICGHMRKYASDSDFVQACLRDHGSFNADTLSVQAVFEVKAPATVEKRASSLSLYALWFETSGHKTEDFFSESAVFMYTAHLDADRAPASRAQCCKEALNFVGGLFSLELASIKGSRRIAGMCTRLKRRAGTARQAKVLSVKMVAALEHFVVSDKGSGVPEAIVAGSALFALFGRARIGDLARCMLEPSKDGDVYLETGLIAHKTARPGTSLSLLVVAPMLGITSTPWGGFWLEGRERACLRADRDGSLLPARGRDGAWVRARMLTQEFAAGLRVLLLKLGFGTEDIQGVGSHSLKATILSWMAKRGTDREVRRVLGYHIKPGDRVLEGYSRDSLSAPLREMLGVITESREGKFEPDNTRSGHIKSDAPAPPSSSASPCSTDDEVEEVDLTDNVEDDEHVIILNKRTGMHHLLAGEGLACGKCKPNAYEVVHDLPVEARLCSRCF